MSQVDLISSCTCPHCWAAFAPEDVLWISAHTELLGDVRLGPEKQQRFLPTRFTLDGRALDARGFPCDDLACPRCHLPVPRLLLEAEPLFLSILGAPACGKSFFLSALTWQLRRLLPEHFGLSFTDADTVSNRTLNEYEEMVFLNADSGSLVALADLIRKTELHGELYDTTLDGDQAIRYPRPFLFHLEWQSGNAEGLALPALNRVLCLYDNAGEHFLAGQDSTGAPVTHHLGRSEMLIFLFDPTQDERFRRLLARSAAGIRTPAPRATIRQELILVEAAARVRRYTGLTHRHKYEQPLIVTLTKADVWGELLSSSLDGEPLSTGSPRAALDLPRIQSCSGQLRTLLVRICPELVTAAENFASHVIYLPVSALGQQPEVDHRTGKAAIRPCDIKPRWIAVPMLYGLSRVAPGIIPCLGSKQTALERPSGTRT
jgi:hypothetical protein